jgi:hypothetical protein
MRSRAQAGFRGNFSDVSLNCLFSRSAFGSSFAGSETVLRPVVLGVSLCGDLDLFGGQKRSSSH